MNPPSDLATWVGSLVLTAAIGAAVARFFSRGDKAEADWRGEVKANLGRLLDGQALMSTTQQLQAKDIAALQATCIALDKRQENQATAHKDAIAALRGEFAK